MKIKGEKLKGAEEQEPEIYFVFNPRGEKPTKRHKSYKGASTEALRLAKEHTGDKFFVLKAIESFKIPLVPKLIHKNYLPQEQLKPAIGGYDQIAKLYARHNHKVYLSTSWERVL